MAASNLIQLKINSFEYLTSKLIDWYEKKNNSRDFENKFSTLKLIKLHFFVCAASTVNSEIDLLSTFNRFHAMPYGHVESDIYDAINSDNLQYFKIDKYSIKTKATISKFDCELKDSINKAIDLLITKNPDLINYSAMDLVELSHQWHSWQSIYNLARSQNMYSLPIPSEVIRKEDKFFHLPSYA